MREPYCCANASRLFSERLKQLTRWSRSLRLIASARTFAQRPRPTAAPRTGSVAIFTQLLESFFNVFRGGVGDALQKLLGFFRSGLLRFTVPAGRSNFSNVF